MNMSEIAEVYDVDIRTIRTWVSRGCPFLERGGKGARPWQFESSDVIGWREQQAAIAAVGDVSKVDVDEARRRKLAAEAALSELELAKAKGEVIALEDIQSVWLEIVSNCRSLLLAMPSKVAPVVAAESELRPIRDLLTDEIEECLAELSRFECGDIDGSDDESENPDQSGVSEIQAAAKTDGERVGGSRAVSQS